VVDVVVEPLAIDEIAAAEAWYEERRPGLGLRFRRAVGGVVARLEDEHWPVRRLAFMPMSSTVRWLPCRAFHTS
jgi:hypothetical protein